MIFQDPTKLSPRQSTSAYRANTLDFTLRLNTELSGIERKRIYQTLRQVGLLPEHANYYPRLCLPQDNAERIALARALILFAATGDYSG